MKNKTILIVGLILVIVGVTVLIKKNNTPVVSEPIVAGLEELYSSTTGERIKQIETVDNGTTTANIDRPIKSDKEVKRSMSFACNDHKVIEGIFYVGGQNPRYEFTVTDYNIGVKDIQNEVRRFILTQIPSEVGIRFVNKDRSVVLAANDDRGTLEEYGKPIVNNCLFQTSAVIE